MSSEEKRKKNWAGESVLSMRRNGQKPLGAVDEIKSESSAKRPRSTIPCQVEGSGEDVGTMAENEEETDNEERKGKFLRTVERLLKPSARKRHVIGGEKKKELGWRKCVVDEMKWPETVRRCGRNREREFRETC